MKPAFVNSPTEQTTAVTDMLLAFLALGCSLFLFWLGRSDPWKANLWAVTLGLLAVSGLLGGVAHGIKLPAAASRWLWHLLYLILGLVVGLFGVGVLYDLGGLVIARWALPLMITISLLFFGATLIKPDSFIIFTLYQTAAMLMALLIYGGLAITGQLAGAGLMALGVLVTLIAGAIQATQRVSFTLIWNFDHNSVYHLVQMAGVVLLTIGLHADLRS